LAGGISDDLLIFGAGMDRPQGIDFPSANTLLADVSSYLERPSEAVDEALRAMLPGLRFCFNSMIAGAVEKIAHRMIAPHFSDAH
jgi:hypothetical protein